PDSLKAYTDMPSSPPPAVKDLIAQAPKDSKWAEFDWLRQWVLQNVTAAGLGTPVSITPDRANQIVGQTKEASPYEMVALQVMLARWAGLPARIGYGFDGGTKVGDHLEVHPINGVSFPEVWFRGSKWVPVIGQPQHAKASTNGGQKQSNPNVLPSQDIGVTLYVPYLVPPQQLLY